MVTIFKRMTEDRPLSTPTILPYFHYKLQLVIGGSQKIFSAFYQLKRKWCSCCFSIGKLHLI